METEASRTFVSLAAIIVSLIGHFHSSSNVTAVPLMSVGDFDIEFYLLEEMPGRSYVGSVADFKPAQAHLESTRFRFLMPTKTNAQSAAAADDSTSMFTIDEHTGNIQTVRSIDRDRICPRARICVTRLDVVVQHPVSSDSVFPSQLLSKSHNASPFGSGNRLEIIRVGVHIMDINDCVPSFPSPIVRRTIVESASVGSAGFLVPGADDADGPPHGIQRYFIADGFGSVSSSSSVSAVPFNVSLVAGSGAGGLAEGRGGYQLRLAPTERLDRESVDR